MKTSKIFLPPDKSNNKETPIKAGAGRLLKSMLIIFMLSLITLLSSCLVPGPGHGNRGSRNERHGQKERQGNNERHDNGEHRGNNDHRNK
jgi:hypothetical protein